MHLVRKTSQVVLSALGMSLIAAGTMLTLHSFTSQAVWISSTFGIADEGIGITLFIGGLALVVYSTRTRIRPPRRRMRLHKKPSPRKPPAKPVQSAQDTASDLEALIRWDEDSREGSDSLSDPLAEAYSGSSPTSRTAPRRER